MKLAQFKDKEEFHAWQLRSSRGVDDRCQQAISVMAFPVEYPCAMVWDIREEYDENATSFPNNLSDVLHYRYVYLGHFPTKRLKKGMYVYQVFQTGDCADI